MATSTIKSSLGDYSSLSAWEAAKQADITGLGPEQAECYDFQDTTDVAISGWTTTASDYVRIYTPAAERHDGRSRDVTGTGYQISSTQTSGVLRIAEEYVRIEGIDIVNTATGGSPAINFPSALGASNDVRVNNCILHDGATAGAASYIIIASLANLNLTFHTNTIYGKQRGADTRNSNAVDMDYCTFFTDAASLGIVADTELTCNNTYVGGYSSECFWTGGASPTGSHNASSDTSASTDYTSSLVSKAASSQFVNASVGASADFTELSTSALRDQGTPVAGITEDNNGDTRDATTPDIGSDEYPAAGGISIPVVMHHLRQQGGA